MARENLFKSESAAAIAIAAVLLLGLAFTVISIVKLNYAPEWKINAERDYSYDAWSSMEDVKTRGEIFTRFMESDIDYPYGLSATVPFSMGGGDVPVFEPTKSNSKLAVNTEECIMTITVANHTFPHTVDCGGITYYSENRQYPDQVFRYENGALILAQGESSQMKRKPSFDIQKSDSENYTVTINAINLTGEPASISSSTLTALRLTGNSTNPFLNSSKDYHDERIDSFNLSIYTHYTDAWAAYLNDTAKEKGLTYGTDYRITSSNSDSLCLSFLPTGNNNYSIYVNETVLCAELGAGGMAYESTGGGNGTGSSEDEEVWYLFEKASGTYKGNQFIIDPTLLQEYNSSIVLPSKNSPGTDLNPYFPKYEFTYNLQDNNKNLDMNLGFNNNTSFESTPSSATILMVYRYEKSEEELPTLEMSFNGNNPKTITSRENWSLYEETFSIPSSSNSLSDLKFILTVKTASKNQGTLHVDYLAVRLD
jgi:hypothetical protein